MASLAGWQTRQSNFKSVTGNFSRKPLLISGLQLVEPQTLGQQWDRHHFSEEVVPAPLFRWWSARYGAVADQRAVVPLSKPSQNRVMTFERQ